MSDHLAPNIDKMKSNAKALQDRGADAQRLTSRIKSMLSDSEAAFGSDANGRDMHLSYTNLTGDMVAQATNHSEALTSTGRALGESARVFDETEKNNVERGKNLGAGIQGPTSPGVSTSGNSSTSTHTTVGNPGGGGGKGSRGRSR